MHQDIPPIPCQRLSIYLKKIFVARNLLENFLSQKHSLTTYLESLKSNIISSLEPTIFCLFQKELKLNTLKVLKTKVEFKLQRPNRPLEKRS